MAKKITLSKLNKMYSVAKLCDKKVHAEQRTNILLKNGDHYNKRAGHILDNLRTRGSVSEDTKIRITKNHIHRICNLHESALLESPPSVRCYAFNDDEPSDTKAAEHRNAILGWVKDTNVWKKKQKQFISDFIVVGETFSFTRWDSEKGSVIGKSEDGKDIRSGEFIIDKVYGFDMKRDPASRSWDENRYVIVDTLVDVDDFIEVLKETKPEKVGEFNEDMVSDITIFDTNTNEYRTVKDKVEVREFIWKPTPKMQKGKYILATKDDLLLETELPAGIFPINKAGFDNVTASPRSTSIIKVCRPYQVEINRSASKMAEHQITLGDDKVYIQKGTKLSAGGRFDGIRAYQVSGREPIIQEGRTGMQYLEYQLSQIREMYEAVGLADIALDKPENGDAFLMLYRSMKDKKKFTKYVSSYEDFEIDTFKTVLELAKFYLEPIHIIKIAGRKEAVNIEEFKRTDNVGFEFKVEPVSSDMESRLGKMFSITQIMQYAGGSLGPEQLGQLIKNLPVGNADSLFSTLTIDQDNLENDILALDRGEIVMVNANDNHEFIIRGLSHRMRKADFRFMAEQVKMAYQQVKKQHEQILAQQMQIASQEKLGMIPSGGFLTTVNASWRNPATNRIERIKVPSMAIEWLVDKLNKQGGMLTNYESLPPEVQANMAGSGALSGTPQAQPQPQVAQQEPQAL